MNSDPTSQDMDPEMDYSTNDKQKEENLDSDESLSLSEAKVDINLSLPLSPPDSSQLKRQVFYAVCNNPIQARHKYDEILNEHLKYFDDVTAKVKEYHENRKELYDPQLQLLDDRVKEKETQLEVHLRELPEVKTNREELEEKVEAQKLVLRDLLCEIGQAKQNLIMDRIEKAREELLGHVINTDLLVEQKQKLSKAMYDNRSDVFKNRVIRFNKLLETFEQELNSIRAKIPFGEGINATFFQYLLRVGLVLAGAAGWFFATYAVLENLGNSDFVSLAFAKLIMAGRTLFPDDIFLAVGFNFGIYVFIVIILLGMAWLGSSVLKRVSPEYKNGGDTKKKRKGNKNQAEGDNSFILELGEGNSMLRTKVESNNLFVFLIQLLPIVLVVGVVLTTISISVTADELKELSISLAGQVIGTAIAIGLSGVVLIYIYLVIEPRLTRNSGVSRSNRESSQDIEENKREKLFRRSWANNWELVLLLGLLFVGLIAIVSGLASNRWIASSIFSRVVRS